VLGVQASSGEKPRSRVRRPDYHAATSTTSIGAGAIPEWAAGVQVMPDSYDQYFEGIALLDATKLVPEELVPCQPIGRMTLTVPVNISPNRQVASMSATSSGIDSPTTPLLRAASSATSTHN